MRAVGAEIQPESQRREVERTIAALAARQHGVVARWQLRELGLGDGAIRHRLALRRLNPVFRGVYAVGYPRKTGRGRWMAAVLSCGRDSALSHVSASSLMGILASASASIHVIAPHTSRRGRPGVIVHHSKLPAQERIIVEGIPVTSVGRTLLDLAETVSRGRLEEALECAERRQIFDLSEIESVCSRGFGRRGLKTLLPLLSEQRPTAKTRSEFEREFLCFCREQGLPTPSINCLIAGHEVDASWPDRCLVVELDGFEFHRTRAAFERDRERDGHLLDAGYQVLRVTYRRLEREPEAIAASIRRLLA